MEEVVTYIIDYCNGTEKYYNECFFETLEQVYDYIHKIFNENPNIKIKIICGTYKKQILIGTIYDKIGNEYWHLMIE